jgi:hypothetical protein
MSPGKERKQPDHKCQSDWRQHGGGHFHKLGIAQLAQHLAIPLTISIVAIAGAPGYEKLSNAVYATTDQFKREALKNYLDLYGQF